MTTKYDFDGKLQPESSDDIRRELRARLEAADRREVTTGELPEPIVAALRALDEVLQEVVGRRDDYPDAQKPAYSAYHAHRYMIMGCYIAAYRELSWVFSPEHHAVLDSRRVDAAVVALMRAVHEHGTDDMRAAFRTDLHTFSVAGTVTV